MYVCSCTLTFLMSLSCDLSWSKVHTLFRFILISTYVPSGVLFVSFRATLGLELKSYCMAIGHRMTKFGNLAVSARTTSFLIQYLYDLYQTVINFWEVPFS